MPAEEILRGAKPIADAIGLGTRPMPQTTAERLAALEADNAEFRARLAKVEDKVEPPPPPVPDHRYGGTPHVELTASVRIVAEPLPPDLSDVDLRELRRIVGVAHPGLVALSRGTSEHQALRQFANALRAVGMLFGTATLDHEHALSWWVDHAQSIVDRGAGHADFYDNDFTAAALASGVFYRAWSPSVPIKFGLLRWPSHGSSVTSWPLRDQWRQTLKGGRIGPLAEPAHPIRDSRVGLWAGPT